MLAFQLALCIGFVHGANTSASDEEYLLARQAQMPLRGDVPDYMERWNEEWAKQLPLNALNQFVALAGRLATQGAPGQLAGALLSIFWPSGFWFQLVGLRVLWSTLSYQHLLFSGSL